MKLVIGSLYADRLNLNGDQGNIRVLQRRAAASAIEVEVVEVRTKQDLNGVDLFFVGHGSIAAWRSIPEAAEVFQAARAYGLLTLAVAFGAERVADAQGLSVKHGERVSKFETHRLKLGATAIDLVGYVNSSADLKSVVFENCVLTTLHGPVLAKNPALADWLLEEAVSRSGGVLQEPTGLVQLDDLAAAARRDSLR